MKRTFILLLTLVLCAGCTRIDNIENIDLIVDAVLKDKTKPANETSVGYKYYLPIGMTKVYDLDYNQKFKLDNNYMYLYTDIVSYYYKNSLNFNEELDEVYYYTKIDNNGKTGYIKVLKEKDDEFYIKVVYNYAKIESYGTKTEINKILTNSMIILNSIDYNDILIENIIADEYAMGADKEYKIDKPKDAESKFSEYLSESVQEEEYIPELPEY